MTEQPVAGWRDNAQQLGTGVLAGWRRVGHGQIRQRDRENEPSKFIVAAIDRQTATLVTELRKLQGSGAVNGGTARTHNAGTPNGGGATGLPGQRAKPGSAYNDILLGGGSSSPIPGNPTPPVPPGPTPSPTPGTPKPNGGTHSFGRALGIGAASVAGLFGIASSIDTHLRPQMTQLDWYTNQMTQSLGGRYSFSQEMGVMNGVSRRFNFGTAASQAQSLYGLQQQTGLTANSPFLNQAARNLNQAAWLNPAMGLDPNTVGSFYRSGAYYQMRGLLGVNTLNTQGNPVNTPTLAQQTLRRFWGGRMPTAAELQASTRPGTAGYLDFQRLAQMTSPQSAEYVRQYGLTSARARTQGISQSDLQAALANPRAHRDIAERLNIDTTILGRDFQVQGAQANAMKDFAGHYIPAATSSLDAFTKAVTAASYALEHIPGAAAVAGNLTGWGGTFHSALSTAGRVGGDVMGYLGLRSLLGGGGAAGGAGGGLLGRLGLGGRLGMSGGLLGRVAGLAGGGMMGLGKIGLGAAVGGAAGALAGHGLDILGRKTGHHSTFTILGDAARGAGLGAGIGMAIGGPWGALAGGAIGGVGGGLWGGRRGIGSGFSHAAHWVGSIFGGSATGGGNSGGQNRGGRSGTTGRSIGGPSGSQVIGYAEHFIGTPYVWGGESPQGFDCSGYMQYVFGHFGVRLPRTAAEQQSMGKSIPVNQAQAGDLIFYGHPAHHVGLAIGGGRMIAAPHTGDVVKIEKLYPGDLSARRILNRVGGVSTVTDTGNPGSGGMLNQSSSKGDIGALFGSGAGAYGGSSELAAFAPMLGSESTAGGGGFAGFGASSPSMSTTNNAGNRSGARVADVSGVGVPANPKGNVALGKKLAARYHWDRGAEWNALYKLWNLESGWDNNAQNATSTAYGIPQFLDSTWESVGFRKTSDPGQQILAGLKYIKTRRGDPVHAWQFENSHTPPWYDKGSWEIVRDQLAKLHKGEMVLPAPVADSVRQATSIPGPPETLSRPKGRPLVSVTIAPGAIVLQGLDDASLQDASQKLLGMVQDAAMQAQIASS